MIAAPRAQSAADSLPPSCQRSAGVAAGEYARCSLWLEDDYLILGKRGEPVTHVQIELRGCARARNGAYINK